MDEFLKYLQGLIANINAKLEMLPPLEQFDAASQLVWPLRQLKEYGQDLVGKMGEFEQKISAYQQKVSEEAQAQAETNLLASGKVVLKTDAEVAANAAREEGTRIAREAIQAEMAQKALIVERRAKVVADGVVTAEVSERLSDELFTPENFMDSITKVGTRMGRISELKLNASGASAAMAEMAGIPLDEAGDAVFEKRIGVIKEIAGSGVGSNAERQDGKPGGKAPLDIPPKTSESATKPRVVF